MVLSKCTLETEGKTIQDPHLGIHPIYPDTIVNPRSTSLEKRDIAVSSFFIKALRAMNFPRSTAFIVSHKFEYAVSFFSIEFYKVFNFFISSLTKLLCRKLLSFHEYVGFPLFLFLLMTSLNS